MDNGRFLLRTREGKPGEYVLCVVYKGKPTHHLITKNAEGLYICNKKAFGNTKKIVVVCTATHTTRTHAHRTHTHIHQALLHHYTCVLRVYNIFGKGHVFAALVVARLQNVSK